MTTIYDIFIQIIGIAFAILAVFVAEKLPGWFRKRISALIETHDGLSKIGPINRDAVSILTSQMSDFVSSVASSVSFLLSITAILLGAASKNLLLFIPLIFIYIVTLVLSHYFVQIDHVMRSDYERKVGVPLRITVRTFAVIACFSPLLLKLLPQ